jgi:ABC-2 type transport system ATP-binding protein
MQIIVAQARNHRRTTFFSSHLIDEVERCADRVGIIHAGRMRFEGGLAELRERVRRMRLPAGAEFAPPADFELWRDEDLDGSRALTFCADARRWAALDLPPEARVEALSLEEIFIACVGSRQVRTV